MQVHRLLAIGSISMPLTKLCQQCKAAVHERYESSVKSARKAQDKLQKACERASETCERSIGRSAWQA